MKVTNVKDHLLTLYQAGCRHTVILLGPPGIGKSTMPQDAAKELNISSIQWQATIEDPLELPGLPAVINNKAVRVPFEDKIPSEGAGFLIIDELNSASKLTQCSFYSLIWDRKLGGSILGKDWMIIATGNHDKDGGVTQKMPTPLVSRMEHINVEPDPDGWITWMAIEGGHDGVRAFMKSRPELFVTFKSEIPGPFACPRTWTMVGKIMQAYGKGRTPPFESIAGWVGEGPAREFMAYQMMADELIDPDLIIKDPDRAPIPDTPGAKYAITTALASKATYQNYSAILRYLERIDIEFMVYCVASARSVERGRLARMSPEEKAKAPRLSSLKSHKDWSLKHAALIADE